MVATGRRGRGSFVNAFKSAKPAALSRVWSSGISIVEVFSGSGFALTVDPLFFGKVGKTIFAGVRPPLRGGPLAPAPWCGPAPTGHPWPNGARSASMPSDPHHGTSIRPPDARFCGVLEVAALQWRPRTLLACGVSHAASPTSWLLQFACLLPKLAAPSLHLLS
jgi:hypothetical protein